MSRWSIVVAAAEGGRPLLRTVDSLPRSRAWDLAIAVPGDVPLPLLRSVVARLGARATHGDGNLVTAINRAAGGGTGDLIAIVPAGLRLEKGALDLAAEVMETSAAAALAPAVREQSPDGLFLAVPEEPPRDPLRLLSEPRASAAALFIRRPEWQRTGGLDAALGGLALCDLWLRLALGGARICAAPAALLRRDIGHVPGNPAYLDDLRRLLLKHGEEVRQRMRDLLVEREVRFGRLRERHRELSDARDRGLKALEEIRRDTSHLRAYLEHHGRVAVEWGDFRRTDPISRDWGYDRGRPLDRRYIEAFVEAHSSDVRGAVLEVQEDDFTRLAGGPRVTASAVLDVDQDNPRATVIADLRAAVELADASFDCVILTQTIHVVEDMAAVAGELHRVLRPGGVLLATVPAASRVCLEYGEAGDFWRATPAGATALVERHFGGAVTAEAYGNVLSNVAFLHGLAEHELTPAEHAVTDPYFPALTGIRARKGGRDRARGAVLLYHRIADGEDVHGLNVPPALFEAHLEWLSRECAVVPLEMLLEAPPERLPRRAVALTFDDGYVDNLECALPLLMRHDAPATIFATARWLDRPGEYWWDILERAGMDAADHRQRHEQLVHASVAHRDAVMAALTAERALAPARYRPMLADELRQMLRHPGITLGVHTVDHLALPDQVESERLRELHDARERLEQVAGRPVTCFAYPYGALDAEVARLVRRTFRWGLTCEASAVPASFDAARVPRTDVKAWDVEAFASRINALLR